ncbi:MAG: SH3 domain-containing protein [Devosiaceae bacterium]
MVLTTVRKARCPAYPLVACRAFSGEGLSQRTMSCPIRTSNFAQLIQQSALIAGVMMVLLAVTSVATAVPALAQAASVQNGVTVGPVTGFPLPRFVSIRPSEANVRVGPGSAYDIEWTFMRSRLPVEITAEFGNWRKIRDMDGDEGWIRHDLLTGQRTAVIAPWSEGDPVPARRAADQDANTRFLLEPGVLAEIIACDGQWCDLVSADPTAEWRGYVRQTSLWGAYPDEAFETN